MRRILYSGVYSRQSPGGAKALYLVWQLPDGAYAAQMCDASFQPVSAAARISASDLAGLFSREPLPHAAPPAAPSLERLTAAGSSALPAAGGASAVPTANGSREATFFKRPDAVGGADRKAFDLEASRRAKLLESRLRETFRQTLLRLKRPRERQAAVKALEQLARTEEGVVPEHKHMFRDFGVRLRQNFQPRLALLFNRRVVELAPDDDHARFNLARILCALGQYDEAASQMRAAMDMVEGAPLYSRMLEHILQEQAQRGALAHAAPR